MGKRSREKRERREEGEVKPKKEREWSESGLASICLTVIRWGTYLALFTPLILNTNFFFPFVSPKSLYFMGLVEIIFFTWLILIVHSQKYRPRLNYLTAALILFLVVVTLSSIFGENFANSFWSKAERMTGLLMWFHLFAFFLVISSTFREKEDWLKIFAVILFVGLILGFISFFSQNPTMKGGATLGNTSFLGTYLLFCVFFGLYLVLTTKKELRVYSIICFLIILLTFFLIGGARAAKLSFLAGVLLLVFLYLAFVPKKKVLIYFGRFLLAGTMVAFLISAFLVFQPDSFVHQKFIQLATKARLVVWEGAWQGFLERPLLGWGPENFDFVFVKYFNPCMFLPECGGEIWFDRAHNIIFDTLVITGILGFLAYLGVFLSVFYLLWKNYFKKEETSNGVGFWSAGIFSVLLISYSIQNLTVFDMVSSYLMFFLVLGFVGSINVVKEMPDSPRNNEKFFYGTKVPSWFLGLILILFIFSFFYFIIQPLKTSHYTIAALRAPAASQERLNLYEKTLRSSPLGKYQIREFFGQTTLEFSQTEKVREVSAENFKKEIDFVITELEKSKKESPLDFRSHLKLGQLYNVYAVLIDETKISEAERVLQRAIEISPTNQQGYWSLAQTRLYQGRIEEAFSLAERAKDLEPKLERAHEIIVNIAKITGNYELAEEKINEAIKIDPSWEEDLRNILD